MAEQTSPPEERRRVLLLEDDDMLADLLARVLRDVQYRVDVIDSGEELPPPDKLEGYDLVLADVHLAGAMTGFDVLKAVHASAENLPVILMTAMADVEGVMRAMGEGAHDYLAKPIDPTELKAKVREVVNRRRMASGAHDVLEAPGSMRGVDVKIVGSTPAMIDVYKTVAQVARTTATVLINGESGSGKELVARKVHDESSRAARRFVAVNCAALPESILESELFGHERGSFTGAAAQKRGLFEEATGGTLFLDEIGEISPKMQVQLLRVLEEGEIRRVGGNEPIPVDVRLVAATNRDLREEVKAGRFRQDLFFRLQVVTIRVPPLRERRGDIPLLVHHFVARHSARLGSKVPRISREAIDALTAYDFPGNVRELSHMMERALLLARDGVITVSDLTEEVTKLPTASQTPGALDISDWPTVPIVTRRYIDRVLAHTGGNKTRAAEILALDRRTLSRMFARERRAGATEEEIEAETARIEREDEAE